MSKAPPRITGRYVGQFGSSAPRAGATFEFFFDRITLGALILALGLRVDDTIIAIEVMVVKMEEGMDRIKGRCHVVCGLTVDG